MRLLYTRVDARSDLYSNVITVFRDYYYDRREIATVDSINGEATIGRDEDSLYNLGRI